MAKIINYILLTFLTLNLYSLSLPESINDSDFEELNSIDDINILINYDYQLDSIIEYDEIKYLNKNKELHIIYLYNSRIVRIQHINKTIDSYLKQLTSKYGLLLWQYHAQNRDLIYEDNKLIGLFSTDTVNGEPLTTYYKFSYDKYDNLESVLLYYLFNPENIDDEKISNNDLNKLKKKNYTVLSGYNPEIVFIGLTKSNDFNFKLSKYFIKDKAIDDYYPICDYVFLYSTDNEVIEYYTLHERDHHGWSPTVAEKYVNTKNSGYIEAETYAFDSSGELFVE